MKPERVSCLSGWLGITEIRVFEYAFEWKYGFPTIPSNLFVEFVVSGSVPAFVDLYIRTVVYPKLIVRSAHGGNHFNYGQKLLIGVPPRAS